MPFLIIILLLGTAIIFPKLIQYNRSQYKEESGNGFVPTIRNKQYYAEFLAFTYLEEYGIYRRLITNREFFLNPQESTKLDLVMIHEGGIYIFDVNYHKGKILGNGKSKTWSATYKNEEQHFQNPLEVNKERMLFFKNTFPEIPESRVKSFVLLQNECTLEIDQKEFDEGILLKMKELIKYLNEDMAKADKFFSQGEIDNIYDVIKKSTR